MVATLRHRGPDGVGVHTDGPVGLAHARLSVVDIAGGAQPMRNADGSAWVTFNGEVFNHVELREELAARGRAFASRSDTEVLLALYEAFGDAGFERANGQWAFALWDRLRGRLVLSRDRLGVRPLYYVRTPGTFAFASEVKALFAHPDVPRALDLRGLDQVLTLWCTAAPTTMFAGVAELAPGHSLVLEPGAPPDAPRRYWSLDYSQVDETLTADEHAARLRALLDDATRLRQTRADVPVGAYLSGGLDSATTVGLARRVTNGARIDAFSVTFESPEFDESAWQREVAAHLGVSHHQVLCRAEDIGRVFPDVVRHAETVLVRTAPAPLFILSELVRANGYKVVLTGEGADEMLGGYDIFKEAKVRRWCAQRPESRMRPLLLRRLYPYMPGIQAQSAESLAAFFRARPADLDDPFFSHAPRWELTATLKGLLSRAARAELGIEQAGGGASTLAARGTLRAELPPGYPAWAPFCQAQYLEARYLLPGYILASQGDRMAMAHGIEGRYPFLDYRVAELAARIPPRFKMRGLDEKYVLKRAVADVIPPMLTRRPKQPYRAPAAPCFFDPATGAPRFDYVARLLDPEHLARSGVFEPAAVRRVVEKARAGRAASARDGMALVAVLSAELLAEQLLRNDGSAEDARRD